MKQNVFRKRRICGWGFFIAVLLVFVQCSSDSNDLNDGTTDNNGEAVSYESLMTDTLFQKGFNLSSTQDGNAEIAGVLNYNGATTETPYWEIAQWYCFNNDLTTASYSVEGNQLCYKISDEGNKLYVDTIAGEITMELNAETEYGYNGLDNPRVAGEGWPHLLLQHDWSDNDCLKISDKEEILMDITYDVLKCDNETPDGQYDSSLHTAQFQWFITVQNRNSSSIGYGSEYIWFGLCFYDDRYDYAPFYAAEDGGKDENTGAFIYEPAMTEILSNRGKTVVGEKKTVQVDILPYIRSAYELARERNYLSNTNWDDLYIGSTNIGWEVPGTYNVSVDISKLNIRYK